MQRDRHHRILVCTPSNAAADSIASKLIPQNDGYTILRLHALSREPMGIPQILWASSNVEISLTDPNKLQDCTFKVSAERLQQSSVVICTLATAALLNTTEESLKFHHLFIDEAAQATETQVLVPLTHLLKRTDERPQGALVLCGDHLQLGPVLARGIAAESGLSVSLLQRLITRNQLYCPNSEGQYNPAVVIKLCDHYRSVPELVILPNRHFYHNQLRPLRDSIPEHTPLEFYGMDGRDQKEKGGNSRYNLTEVKQVITLLRGFLHWGDKQPEQIGIITPYTAQAIAIREEASKLPGGNRVKVGSTEQFQGMEKDIIITSTVRHDPIDDRIDRKGVIGFLGEPNRFNVLTTRAKDKLCVVGSPMTLMTERLWADLIIHCVERDCLWGKGWVHGIRKKMDRLWPSDAARGDTPRTPRRMESNSARESHVNEEATL
jgi:helicase MOV-10